MAVRRRSVERSKGGKLTIVVDVGRWLEQCAGFLDEDTALRIEDEDDFDSVIEEVTGSPPDGGETIFPGRFYLDFGDSDEVLQELADHRVSCELNGASVEYDLIVLPTDEDMYWDASGWDGDSRKLTPEAVDSLGAASAEVLALREQHEQQLKDVYRKVVEYPSHLWTHAMSWKGCEFTAETKVNSSTPKIALVLFQQSYIVPWGDELMDDDDDVVELTLSSSSQGLYLAAIVVDGKVVDFDVSDEEAKTEEKLLITYASGEGYFVKDFSPY